MYDSAAEGHKTFFRLFLAATKHPPASHKKTKNPTLLGQQKMTAVRFMISQYETWLNGSKRVLNLIRFNSEYKILKSACPHFPGRHVRCQLFYTLIFVVSPHTHIPFLPKHHYPLNTTPGLCGDDVSYRIRFQSGAIREALESRVAFNQKEKKQTN